MVGSFLDKYISKQPAGPAVLNDPLEKFRMGTLQPELQNLLNLSAPAPVVSRSNEQKSSAARKPHEKAARVAETPASTAAVGQGQFVTDQQNEINKIFNPQSWNRQTAPVSVSQTKHNLAIGAKHSDVSLLQRALHELGYKELTVTGNFGALTDKCVRDFQSKHGLVVDGIVGQKTKAAMAQASTSVTKSEVNVLRQYSSNPIDDLLKHMNAPTNALLSLDQALTKTPGLVKFGSFKAGNMALQSELVSLGFSDIGIDGIFGNKTEAAVNQIKKQAGLPEDGKVDRQFLATVSNLKLRGIKYHDA